jgi:hypothetical protein
MERNITNYSGTANLNTSRQGRIVSRVATTLLGAPSFGFGSPQARSTMPVLHPAPVRNASPSGLSPNDLPSISSWYDQALPESAKLNPVNRLPSVGEILDDTGPVMTKLPDILEELPANQQRAQVQAPPQQQSHGWPQPQRQFQPPTHTGLQSQQGTLLVPGDSARVPDASEAISLAKSIDKVGDLEREDIKRTVRRMPRGNRWRFVRPALKALLTCLKAGIQRRSPPQVINTLPGFRLLDLEIRVRLVNALREAGHLTHIEVDQLYRVPGLMTNHELNLELDISRLDVVNQQAATHALSIRSRVRDHDPERYADALGWMQHHGPTINGRPIRDIAAYRGLDRNGPHREQVRRIMADERLVPRGTSGSFERVEDILDPPPADPPPANSRNR